MSLPVPGTHTLPALWAQHNYENSVTQGAFTPQVNHFSLLVSQQFQDPFLPALQWSLQDACYEVAPRKMTFTCFYRVFLGFSFLCFVWKL